MSSVCSFYAVKVAFDIVSKFSSPIRKRSRIEYNHPRACFYCVYYTLSFVRNSFNLSSSWALCANNV